MTADEARAIRHSGAAMNARTSMRFLQDQFESLPADESDDSEYVAPELRAEVEFDTMDVPAADWIGDGNEPDLMADVVRAAAVAHVSACEQRQLELGAAVVRLRDAYIAQRVPEIERAENDWRERQREDAQDARAESRDERDWV